MAQMGQGLGVTEWVQGDFEFICALQQSGEFGPRLVNIKVCFKSLSSMKKFKWFKTEC